jgi:cell division septation protein DedD
MRVVSGRMFLQAAATLSALAAFSTRSASSQSDPRLVEAIRDAQEGDSDSARVKVQRLLATTAPTDTLYPQIVYTQAMVSGDAGNMRRQLQRVAVEYSSSSWADDALLRLVQLDYASGNLDGAARNLERIRLDYPGSPLIPQAAYWAARTYFDQKKPDLACRWVADGMSNSSGNVELQNQLGYLNQRCAQFAAAPETPRVDSQPGAPTAADSQPVVIATRPDSSGPSGQPPAAPRADSVPAATVSGTKVHYRLQITAVRNLATAQSLALKLKDKGYNPLTVEEAGLYKVRIGDYGSKAEAAAAIPAVKAKLGGSPFVVAGS